MAGLKHFRHRRHEVIVFHVLDPAELEFPFRETTLFRGLEGLPEILTEPHAYGTPTRPSWGLFLTRSRRGAGWQISIMFPCAPIRVWKVRYQVTWPRARPAV